MSNVQTSIGQPVTSDLVRNYFRNLVNQFFKILPMRENEETSLCEYMRSFQKELLGCKELVPELKENSQYLTLLAILQYLIDNVESPELSTHEVRREVFRAISICNKLKSLYANMGV